MSTYICSRRRVQIYYHYIYISKLFLIKFSEISFTAANRLYTYIYQMKIVLIGYMGSGKSSVGKSLAHALDYSFVDLDHAIETSDDRTVATIFASRGEIYFRKKEATVLKEILATENNLVLATGGGTPCYGAVMQSLNENPAVHTIYLKVSLEVLTNRLFQERAQRPLIAHLETKALLNDFIRKHLFERSYYYSQAKTVIDVSTLSVEAATEAIVATLY